MAIQTGDLIEYLSAVAGSTGGVLGSSVTSGVQNNVWPDVTDLERVAGGTRYRKTFWKNTNATDAALLPVMYASVLPTAMTLSLGLGVNDAADNDSAQGNMTAFGATAAVALISDGTDTRTCTIFGLSSGGVPQTEDVLLTSTSEVVSALTYSKVYAVIVSATSARVVTVRQGSGGTVRGTINPSKKLCWLWVSAPSTKAAGIALPNLAAGQTYGLWRRLVWATNIAAQRPNTLTMVIEENA